MPCSLFSLVPLSLELAQTSPACRGYSCTVYLELFSFFIPILPDQGVGMARKQAEVEEMEKHMVVRLCRTTCICPPYACEKLSCSLTLSSSLPSFPLSFPSCFLPLLSLIMLPSRSFFWSKQLWLWTWENLVKSSSIEQEKTVVVFLKVWIMLRMSYEILKIPEEDIAAYLAHSECSICVNHVHLFYSQSWNSC